MNIRTVGNKSWCFSRRLECNRGIQQWQCRNAERDGFAAFELIPDTPNQLAVGSHADAVQDNSEYFDRLAFLSTTLPGTCFFTAIDVCWELGNTFLVVDQAGFRPFATWRQELSQWASQRTLVELGRQFIQALAELHTRGYVHNRLHARHLWVGPSGELRLAGLEGCEPIGARLGDRVASAETVPSVSSGEANTADDIGDAAQVLSSLWGRQFLDSPVGRSMAADDHDLRPTASHLHELLLDLEHRIGCGRDTELLRAA